MRISILSFLLLWVSVSVYAESFENVSLVRVYDGDTIFVNIAGVPVVFGESLGIRLARIDTPEIRGKCQEEKQKAIEVREFVKSLLQNATNINLVDVERGKYFRVVAEVIADGENISDILLEKGYAMLYDGKSKKQSWC